MKEEIKKVMNEPIEVNKVGRGEIVKFHVYRIYKSGRLEDCYGNALEPINKDGIAYISLLDINKKPILVEVARVLYSSLVTDIDIMSSTPRIIYKDGNGMNFRLDNIEIEKEELIDIKDDKKYFDIDKILEDDDVVEALTPPENNPIETLKVQVAEMEKVITPKNTENDELVKEISEKACSLVDANFADQINNHIKTLKDRISTLTALREADETAFNRQLQDMQNEINRLTNIINQYANEKQHLLEQNKNLIAEKESFDKNMVVLSKESFMTMYNTMKQVLAMIDSIEK